MPTDPADSLPPLAADEAVRRVARAREVLLAEIHKVIVGQNDLLEQLLIALLTRGHCLVRSLPGLAKTLSVATLARAVHLKFQRVPFTSDLQPSDLTGREVLIEESTSNRRTYRFVRGPLFTNILLADDFPGAPPQTQATLLQAMQEGQVTVGGTTYELEAPFFVVATQNPAERSGVPPMSAAQLDRFMFSIQLGYPSRDEERRVVATTMGAEKVDVRPVLRARDLVWIQQWVRQIPVAGPLVDYAVDLVRATRPQTPEAPDFVRQWLAAGAGPRAAQHLLLGAQARALIKGRYTVHAADIRWVARPVLRHRLSPNGQAEAAGLCLDQVIERLLQTVPEPSTGDYSTTAPILELADDRGGMSSSRARGPVSPAVPLAVPSTPVVPTVTNGAAHVSSAPSSSEPLLPPPALPPASAPRDARQPAAPRSYSWPPRPSGS